ncbi:D-amino-acid transaminase [Evansella clarkii]|uniref:D-amino-acid transaminase n=1 Tax=Evansella clarkii TaxID=79879 RepID=UPI000B43DCBF|nr:D-amino-acid transaminase [Evansella clarkii]
MGEVAFYKDRFVGIEEYVVPIQERGHQFGDGVYEVIRVYGGEPFLMEEHFDRLERSAAAIDLRLPYRREKLKAIVKEALERSEIKEAEIYFQITRGISPRQHHYPECDAVFALTVRQAKTLDSIKREEGVPVTIAEDDRWLNCYIKSLNLLPNVMAKQKAMAKGCAEAIYQRDGIITEGSSSNAFAVKDGVIYTHPATRGILHGITRATVIELAKEMDIAVKEEKFDTEFFLNADEVFFTSTSVEVMPVSEADGTRFPETRPVTLKLSDAFKKLYIKGQ